METLGIIRNPEQSTVRCQSIGEAYASSFGVDIGKAGEERCVSDRARAMMPGKKITLRTTNDCRRRQLTHWSIFSRRFVC